MYQIRGLKSSLDKVAYPSGKVTNLGTIIEDRTFPFNPARNGGYEGNLFTKDSDNTSPFDIKAEVVVGGRGENTYYKTVTTQKQFSNNGSLLPHNTTDRYLGPSSWAGWASVYYLNQKFKLNRNAVPFSSVNELLVIQARLNNVIDTTPISVGTYVDHRFDGNGIGTIINLPIRTKPGLSSIASPDTYDLYINVKNRNGVSLFTSKTNYQTNKTEYSSFNVNSNNDVIYRYVDLGLSSAKIIEHIDQMYTLEFSYGARFANCVIDVNDELKTALLKGAAKYTNVVFKILFTSSRGYFDKAHEPAPPKKIEAMKKTMRHQSDFLPLQSVIDSNGEFVILKFNRPTKVDIFFDSIGLMYDTFSDANNEIRVNKKATKFTVGGVMTITQKHDFVTGSGSNRTFTFTIPDTTPPEAPVFTDATRNTVSGTAKAGDVVVIEKDGVIIAQGPATATNTFELVLESVELNNGDVLVLYTKDKAGNKSTYVNATVTDILSENKLNMLINTDVYNTI